MPESKQDRRRAPRISSKGSGAASFKGHQNCGTLPPQALVDDVSEGGVHLLFDWPEGADFPLQIGDGMGFQLKVEGTQEFFELWSIVRRVGHRDRHGRLGVGVSFSGLESETRVAFQKALVSLAMTKLRAWRPELLEAKDEGAPGGSALDPGGYLEAAPAIPAAGSDKPPAAVPPPRRKVFLGEILVKQGSLDPERFRNFLSAEFTGDRLLGQELLERGLTTDVAIARALAEQFRLPYADPASTEPDPALAAQFPREIFEKHGCVPLREEGKALVLAVASPPDLQEMDELREGLNRMVKVCVAPESALVAWRKKIFKVEADADRSLRFRAQLRAEYRFVDARHTFAVDRGPSYGLTREISAQGMVLAGPLPRSVTPERIASEGLLLVVQVDCPSLRIPMSLTCTPTKVEPSEGEGEHLITCQIKTFPYGGETD